ncbi:major Facilitator Superfamily protein [Asticcacaulis biprosthecium C19]|uniref:Major Facilitator Superfamily protein n=1 Tax=Asticcacaulis biprosthecium C19 TaxID=715226 RepID=F4QQY9_9CAUL|nr:MFS transporter [Asticcacaulis biprosthecium]EGF90626.1 major Facilitator Superfamily protein [Asticcacaulis biprosthecium C19]
MRFLEGLDIRRLTVVSGLGLGQMIAFGTSLYLLTALSGPIVADTGWRLEWVVGGYSLGILVSAAASVVVGRYVGAGWGHRVLAVSSVLFAMGLGIMAVAPALWLYVAGWCLMGVAMAMGLYDVAFGTAGRLFGQSARASIIQIALWGGFASTVFWPLSHALEGVVGWRWTLAVFAGIHLAVNLPLYLFVIPKPVDATAAGEVRHLRPVKPQGLEGPIYIALGLVITLEMSLVAVMSVYMHTLLSSRGLALETAVALSVLVGPSQVVARLTELTIGRRWPAYLSLCLGVVGVAAGLVLILFGGVFSAPALVIYGAGLGVVSVTSGTVPLLVFGPERYPPLMGRLRRVSLVVQALAPAGAAWILTASGASALLYILLAIASMCLVAAVFLARWSHRLIIARTVA